MIKQRTKLGFIAIIFMNGIILSSIYSAATIYSEFTDPAGDISDTAVDLTSVSTLGSTITLTLADQTDLLSGSYSFILLFSISGDFGVINSGFILEIEGGTIFQYWTLMNLDSDNWSDEPSSNEVNVGTNLEITFSKYDNVATASLLVIAVSDSQINEVDWAPDYGESYWPYSSILSLVVQAKDSAYRNNIDNIETSTESSDTSITTSNGFEILSILSGMGLMTTFIIRRRNY